MGAVNKQTPREQLEEIVVRAIHWDRGGIGFVNNLDENCDAILAVIKGVPAMQKKPVRTLSKIIAAGAGSSESTNKAAVANYYCVKGENAKIDEILAELGATE